jgi:hypothetical protein
MKNIVITGTSHAKWIIPELKKIDKENNYLLVENIKSIKSIIKLFKADSIFFIFAPLGKKKNILLKLLILLKKKIVIDWIGSDVLAVLNDNKEQHKIFNKCINLCEVEWIKDELESVGISAKIGPYITRLYHNLEILDINNNNKKEFIIMSYAGKGREKFYGIDKLLKLAIKYPYIKFKIVGTEGKCYNNIPSNVLFLGWISSTKEILSESSLFVRIPEHDGLSLSVLEALYYAKQVAFSFPLPYTYHIEKDEDLEKVIEELYEKWHNKELIINNAGKDFAFNEYFNKQDEFILNLKNELIL